MLTGALAALLGGCAVENASPDGVTVRANAYHPEAAQVEAGRHCRQFGKQAVLISSQPAPPSLDTLFTRSIVSTFECVTPPAPAEDRPS